MNNSSQTGASIPEYLVKIKTTLTNAKSKDEQQTLFAQSFGQSYFAMFEIIDTPPPIQKTPSNNTSLSGSSNSWTITGKNN